MTPAGTFRDDETRAALRAHRDAVIRRNQLTELIAELRATQAHKVLEPRRTVDSAGDDLQHELYRDGKQSRGYGDWRQRNGG